MKNLYLEEDDLKLISNIKNNNCNDSLIALVNRHSGICFNIGKKFATHCNLSLQDLSDNKYWIIYNAAMSFKDNKGSKFSTWLGNQVRFFCLNFKNKNNKLCPTEDGVLEFLINKNHYNKTNNKQEIIDVIIDLFHQINDPNTKKAIYYRYFSNKNRILNYSEIAEILKVTPQTVLNWHNKFIKLAKKKLTNHSSSDNI